MTDPLNIYIADRRLCLDGDGDVVEADDDTRVSLLVAAGGVLPIERAIALDLVSHETDAMSDDETDLETDDFETDLEADIARGLDEAHTREIELEPETDLEAAPVANAMPLTGTVSSGDDAETILDAPHEIVTSAPVAPKKAKK